MLLAKWWAALFWLLAGFVNTPEPLLPPVGRLPLNMVPWSGACDGYTQTYVANGVKLTFTIAAPGIRSCTFYVPNIALTRRFVSYP